MKSNRKTKQQRRQARKSARKAKAQHNSVMGDTIRHYTTQTGNVVAYRLDDEVWFPALEVAKVGHITGPGRYSLPESWHLDGTEVRVMGDPPAITFLLSYPVLEVPDWAKRTIRENIFPKDSPLWAEIDAGLVPATANTLVIEIGRVWQGFKGLFLELPSEEPACPYLISSVLPGAILRPSTVMPNLAIAERLIAKRLLQLLGLIQ